MDSEDIGKNYRELRLKQAALTEDIDERDALADAEISKLLREYADKIDSGKWPNVYGYYEEKKGPFWELRVVLSYPCGG